MQQTPAAGFGLEIVHAGIRGCLRIGRVVPRRTSLQISFARWQSILVHAVLNFLFSLCILLQVNGAAAWDIGSQNLFTGFDAQFQSVQSE